MFPWIVILYVFIWMIIDFKSFVIVPCLSWAVKLPTSEKFSRSSTFFGFIASAYLNHFQKWFKYAFWDPSLPLRTTKGLTHNYCKRWKHSLMLKKETQCIKNQGVYIWIYIFCKRHVNLCAELNSICRATKWSLNASQLNISIHAKWMLKL